MANLIRGLDADVIAENLAQVRDGIAAQGRDPADVEILAAIKYVEADELPVVAAAGITLVGENRAQDLLAKRAAHAELFAWDFIGQLQSRKVAVVAANAQRIHSLASESALDQLRRRACELPQMLEVLLQVELAGDPFKAGITADAIPFFIRECPVPVTGLMTMPPLVSSAEDSRPWFAQLRELARAHGLKHLSMGTSQDWRVAVAEGATIIRLGEVLYRR